MADEIGIEMSMEPELTTTPTTTTATRGGKLKKPLLNKLIKMDMAELRRFVTDMQSKLDQVEDLNVDLRVQLGNAVEERDILKKKAADKQNTGEGADNAELKHIYDQLLYKDTRIMELNQIIMERERRIIDLQEAFSEQGQVARSKQLAVSLLGKRLQELDTPPRERKDVGTATDESGGGGGGIGGAASARAAAGRDAGGSRWATTTTVAPATHGGGSANNSASSRTTRSPHRNASPGRAIPQLLRVGGTNGSPPPLDPTAEDGCSSYTTTTTADTFMAAAMDTDAVPCHKKSGTGGGGGSRKKVTFFDTDGTPMGGVGQQQNMAKQQQRHHQHVDGMVRRIGTPPPTDEQQQVRSPLAGKNGRDEIDEILAENDQLRRTISEMEKQQQHQQQLVSVGEPLPSSVLILKAKAVAQAKIRELEATLAQTRFNVESERAGLQAAIDQLKESREWALEENAKLLQQLDASKQKCDDLHGELDASLETSAIFRRRLDENAARMEALGTELYQSRAQTQQALDDKNIMGAEVERLKDAIFAQDEFVGMLEGDLLVYEAHVGILRDSLGATKREDRQHIKSKAFTAKLNALEMEKREIVKRNKDEKLRAKALAVKVRYLEQERDELNAQLRHYEREYGIGRVQAVQAVAAAQHGQRSRNSADEPAPFSSSTVLNFENANDGPIDSSSPTTVFGHSVVDRDCSLSMITKVDQTVEPKNDDVAAIAEQLQLQAQQLEAVKSLKQEAEERVQQLELELTNSRQSVRDFVNSIAIRQMPSLINNATICADGNLDSVERFVDELLRNFDTLTEVRAVLEQEVDQLNAQNERSNAEHAVQEQKLRDEMEQLHVQLQHCQGQIDVAHCRIDNLTRIEAEMARELGTRQRELNNTTAELDAIKETKHQLEQQRVELCAQIDALNDMKLALSNQLQQANTSNTTLSNTLSSEQHRLNQLINQLTEIVHRFRSTTAHGNDDGNNFGQLTISQNAANEPAPFSSSTVLNFENANDGPIDSSSPTTVFGHAVVDRDCSLSMITKVDQTVEPKNDDVAAIAEQLQLQAQQLEAVKSLKQEAEERVQQLEAVQTLKQESEERVQQLEAVQTLKQEAEERVQQLELELTNARQSVRDFVNSIAIRQMPSLINNATICADGNLDSVERFVDELLRNFDTLTEVRAVLEQEVDQLNVQMERSNAEHAVQEQKLRDEMEQLHVQLQHCQGQIDVAHCRIDNLTRIEAEMARELGTRQLELNNTVAELEAIKEAKHQLEQQQEDVVVEESTRNTVCQLLASVDPEFATPSIEEQHQQQRLTMLDASTQSSAVDDFPPLALPSLSTFLTTAVQQHHDDLEESDHVAQQQHHDDQEQQQQNHEHRQLLLECIHDRQQFEQELGQNVQQLLALKSELESSVDVLRAEIWALNDELKKKFDERDTLSQRLHAADLELATLRAENEQLKAARLVTKSRDVDALVRENQSLINTNARLQHDLEEQCSNSNDTVHVDDADDDEGNVIEHDDSSGEKSRNEVVEDEEETAKTVPQKSVEHAEVDELGLNGEDGEEVTAPTEEKKSNVKSNELDLNGEDSEEVTAPTEEKKSNVEPDELDLNGKDSEEVTAPTEEKKSNVEPDKWGLNEEDGEEVIAPTEEKKSNVEPDEWGWNGEDGEEVTAPTKEEKSNVEPDKWGLNEEDGEEVTAPTEEEKSNVEPDKWGLNEEDGEEVIAPTEEKKSNVEPDKWGLNEEDGEEVTAITEEEKSNVEPDEWGLNEEDGEEVTAITEEEKSNVEPDEWGWNGEDGEEVTAPTKEEKSNVEPDEWGLNEEDGEEVTAITEEEKSNVEPDEWGWNGEDGEEVTAPMEEEKSNAPTEEKKSNVEPDEWGLNEEDGEEVTAPTEEEKSNVEPDEWGWNGEDGEEVTAPTEEKKSMFDNLVDWAWGDK